MDPDQRPPQKARVTRRTFFRAGLATAAGLIATRLSGRSGQKADAGLLDNCYWQTISGPTCVNHRWKKYRCYICCQPCETVYCEWQDLGPC